MAPLATLFLSLQHTYPLNALLNVPSLQNLFSTKDRSYTVSTFTYSSHRESSGEACSQSFMTPNVPNTAVRSVV